MPKDGQSLIVEGEMIRAIEKLRLEAQNNGNINWDNGFIKFCELLLENLLDRKVFNITLLNSNKEDINRILISSDYFNNLSDNETIDMSKMPYLEDNLYDRLSDSVVIWSNYHGKSIPRQLDSSQYR